MSFQHLDVVKADLRWQIAGIGFAANVFQAMVTQTTPHAVPDSNVIGDMKAWMEDILAPIEPHVVVSCDVVDVSVYQKVGPIWNLVGTSLVDFGPENVGDPLPSGVAALVSAYTDTSRVMGKKYFPGLSELAQTAGLWTAGVLVALGNCGLAWTTSFPSAYDTETFYNPGVYSAKTLGFKFFTAAVHARDVPAYQRRRKQGVGI